MSIYVEQGPAALRVGKYWVGVASGNRYARKLRRTPEAAMKDAAKMEPKRLNETSPMKKPLLKLEEKPCGDVWLHVTPAKGPLASVNLGKRGDHRKPSIVQHALLAAIAEQE